MEAIVLAGGFGTRLQPVLPDVPKSMAVVNGRPFLEYLLDYLIAQGIQRVVLSVGYKRDVILTHFKRKYKTLTLDYAIEEEPLGTGGGIRLAFWKINPDWAFVLNGDSIFRFDLNRMKEHHFRKKADITIALRKLESTGRYGRVTVNRNNRINGFSEKDPAAGPGFINGGVYLIRKNFLMEPSLRGSFSIEKDLFEKCYNTSRFFGFPATGYFLDIGIPEDYKQAQHDFGGFTD